MRETHEIQAQLAYNWLELDHAKELQVVSDLLDQHPRAAQWVLQDLGADARHATGAKGMSAEQVLRALLLKQMHGWSYERLHFHLADSKTFATFCRLPLVGKAPARSTLAGNIKRIRPETLEKIHRLLVRDARERGIEKARTVRVDATVVDAPIHEPTDSSLLWDCVRVLTRLMLRARDAMPGSLAVHDRTRRAKRRHREISSARSSKARRRSYRDLIRATEEVASMAEGVVEQLSLLEPVPTPALGLAEQIEHFLAATERVLDQTRRRVLGGEKVPAEQKLVSIFEQHTDIVVKDRRQTYYGHKICLSAGRSSMILDCQILDGNPADSTLAVPMVERHREIFGRVPKQVAFDGGFASKQNVKAIQDLGTRDAAFHKKRGLEVSEMAKSAWVYRQLRRFRAGVEGCISYLKRTFGLDRCTWRSKRSFHSYVWSSIVSCNLLLMARAVLASGS